MNTPNDREGHAHPKDVSATPHEEQLSFALPGEEPARGDASPTADEALMAAAIEQGEPIAAASDEAGEAAESLVAPEPEPVLVSEMPEFVSAPAVAVSDGASLGTRLKRSRELQNLTLDDVSRRLRIPAARLAELEADAYDRISAPIYVRGYLRSYARLLGLPDIVVTAALERVQQPPPVLIATQTVSRSRYLASRYGNPLVYAVLTAVVVVPLLWAARQGSLMPQSQPRIEALDATAPALPTAPVTTAPAATNAPATAAAAVAELVGPPEATIAPAATAPAAPPITDDRRPVMAAMTPMPSPSYAATPSANAKTVRLTLDQDSWIELIAADGSRIEYGLLRAGTIREYSVQGSANLRIGNTRGATLVVDGARVDLAPHTRSNVARVALGGGDAPAAR